MPHGYIKMNVFWPLVFGKHGVKCEGYISMVDISLELLKVQATARFLNHAELFLAPIYHFVTAPLSKSSLPEILVPS